MERLCTCECLKAPDRLPHVHTAHAVFYFFGRMRLPEESRDTMVKWLKRLHGSALSDDRRRSLLRVARIFLALFLAGSLAGGGRIAWALHTGQTWFNYRGDALRRPELLHGLMLFGVTALLSTLGLILMRRPAQERD